MKKLLLIIVLISCNYIFAQPTILYTSLNSTTPSPSNNRFVLTDLGIFKQCRFQANQNLAAMSLGWAFHIGSTASPNYSANWRASSSGNTLSVNNFIPIGFANGANYSNNAGADGLLPAITNNNYYTINVDSGAATASVAMALLETTYNPTSFVSQLVTAPLASNGAARVTVTMAAPLNAGEYVYMRYASVFNFTGSTLLEIPFVGASGSFFMPCFPAGTNIYYYFFSSNKPKSQIDLEYSTNASNESVYDMSTLRLLNNGGPNYTYAQPTTVATDFAGNYYIPSTCYPKLLSFVTALNLGNVIGPVTVNIASGHLETAPAGGIEINKSGTATNTITFIKDGVGANPIFTASNGHTISKITDAVIKIVGADYITIDGLTLLENPSNTTTLVGSNNMTEYGIAVFYAGTAATADGAQNNTIKNCIIDLNKTYLNTFGIFSNSNVIASDANLLNQASNFAGSNSNLTIIRNFITDVNQGIVVVGSGSATTSHNDGLLIGGSLANANNITNFGTGSTTGFNSVTGTINGIVIRNTKNFNISYNTITSSTAPNISTVRGVFIDSFNQAPTGTLAHTISNNIISLANGTSGAGIEGI